MKILTTTFLLLLISLSVTLCQQSVCDFKLQACATCTRDANGCTSSDPICGATGCPNGQSCIPNDPPTICSIFTSIKSQVDGLAAQVIDLANQITQRNALLTNLNSQLSSIENINDVGDLQQYIGIEFNGKLEAIGPAQTGLDATIQAGMQLPMQTIKLFPIFFKNLNPDKISKFLIERGSHVVNWFTESIVRAAKGIGNGAACSTCLINNLQDGSITFSIGINDGPGLAFRVSFSKLSAIKCFVNNIASLAVIMKDIVPSELVQDSFEDLAKLVSDSAAALNNFSTAIEKSKVCNRNGDTLPVVTAPTTGVEAIDTLLRGLTKFISILGNGGIFGDIANGFVNVICSSNTTEDFYHFAKDFENFAKSVSFPSLEDRIFKAVFNELSKLSNGLATFSSMNLDVPTNCDPSDKACRIANKYGKEYLTCIQQNINSGAVAIRFELIIGEHWLPPSFFGWGISLSGTVDAYSCLLGIKAGVGSIKDILKFVVNDVIESTNDENTRTTCSQQKTCSGGTWDEQACQCRCLGGFIATGTGCQLCPGPTNNVCNGIGICYNSDNGPACCCSNGRTTPDCS